MENIQKNKRALVSFIWGDLGKIAMMVHGVFDTQEEINQIVPELSKKMKNVSISIVEMNTRDWFMIPRDPRDLKAEQINTSDERIKEIYLQDFKKNLDSTQAGFEKFIDKLRETLKNQPVKVISDFASNDGYIQYLNQLLQTAGLEQEYIDLIEQKKQEHLDKHYEQNLEAQRQGEENIKKQNEKDVLKQYHEIMCTLENNSEELTEEQKGVLIQLKEEKEAELKHLGEQLKFIREGMKDPLLYQYDELSQEMQQQLFPYKLRLEQLLKTVQNLSNELKIKSNKIQQLEKQIDENERQLRELRGNHEYYLKQREFLQDFGDKYQRLTILQKLMKECLPANTSQILQEGNDYYEQMKQVQQVKRKLNQNQMQLQFLQKQVFENEKKMEEAQTQKEQIHFASMMMDLNNQIQELKKQNEEHEEQIKDNQSNLQSYLELVQNQLNKIFTEFSQNLCQLKTEQKQEVIDGLI